MSPHVDAVREFTSALDAVPERHGGLPSASSGAMAELADEQSYRTRTAWEQPVSDTHMFGGATLRAATDYVRGIAELFAGDHPPLYAHLTLARAALESAVVCAWLSKPGITTEERIRRGLCEMLYSANEVRALELNAPGGDNVEFWKDVGTALGWTINNSRTKPIIDGTRRPRVSDGVVELSGSGTHARVGDLLYSRLSAVDHVTWFGLFSAFDSGAAQRNERAGTATVPVTVDGGTVSAYLYYVIKVLHAAAAARFTLMGWLDGPWATAAAAAQAFESRLLEIAVASNPERRAGS
jgi:hypothetical protein